ncbi:transmembrane protein 183 [Biomphalaria pfeifferi]|uniref:Transmembrane protein 183 n=1 Tax=Biomphalaria pfeifferi TaxID=112525 RepID=A0AAD8EWG9_BIOPF|nr:transmembrane protein 183 [Biomphalaria pfeifferi]
MPRDGKKAKRRHGHGLLSSSDVSLLDFADARIPQSCGRLRKSVISGMGAIPKTASAQNIVQKEEEETLSWFEKDLEDFVIGDEPEQDEEDESGVKESSSVNSKDLKKKKRENCSGGIVYPADLWFLIGKYIHPEDIGRFAGTCQAARFVTHTSAFWRDLYVRYYGKGKDGLPEHVKPHSMEKLHGLRARVIRAMFILYQPLAQRVQGRGPMEDEPHLLIGNRCLLAWHQPAPKGWLFCFKFQKPSLQPLASKPATKIDIYKGYNDLFYNPEGGCSVLQVTCCHFASVQAVMGLLMNQVYVTLSAGFRHHRLRLHFDSRYTSNNHSSSETMVVLDDVISIKVMKWWYPGYPFTS